MRKYRFYKDELGWFIDLKWFPFNRGYLAMIGGSDELLDILSEEKDEVTVQVDTYPIPFYDGILRRQQKSTLGGATYSTSKGFTEEYPVENVNFAWLCPVTLLLFWRYPKQFYFKVVK